MTFSLRWSRRARVELKALHDYIAQESPMNAKRVVGEIRWRALSLKTLPYIGHPVHDAAVGLYREIPIHSWRLIYQVRGSEVFVVALVHKRRAKMN